jgi:hypothetical protein
MADEKEISGTEALRIRVAGKAKRTDGLLYLVRDLKISRDALQRFADGGKLSEEDLQKLTKEFFYAARFDSKLDKLVDTSPPPHRYVVPETLAPSAPVISDPKRSLFGLKSPPQQMIQPQHQTTRPGFAKR